MTTDEQYCNWCWGSHSCSLKLDHKMPHVCMSDLDVPCSEFDGEKVRYYFGYGEWSDWKEVTGYTV